MPTSDSEPIDYELDAPDQDYQVRLSIDVSAPDPFSAVDAFIEAVNTHGLRKLVFRVIEETDTGTRSVLVCDNATVEESDFAEALQDAG